MSDTEEPLYEGSRDSESKRHSLPEKTPCWVAQRKIKKEKWSKVIQEMLDHFSTCNLKYFTLTNFPPGSLWITPQPEQDQLWFGVNQPGRAANLLLRSLDSLERRLLLLQLHLWNSQLTNTLGKIFCHCIERNQSIFPSHLRPPIPASVPGRLTRLSDVNQAQQVHQFEEHDDQADDANSLKSLRLPPHTHLLLVLNFFKLSYSFLITSLLYFLHLLANPVVLAKFPSLVCCKVFSPTSFCCPSFPKYLFVILHKREQRPNIHVLLEKCQMTAAKIFPKRERDMANQANAA